MSVEIEQLLLGAFLIRNDLFALAGDKLTEADWEEPIHATIFQVCSQLIGMGKLASPVTIKPFLPADWKSGEVTLKEYLARLAAASCTANEVPHLVVALRREADQRALRAACSEVLSADAGVDPGELAAWLVERADSIAVANLAGATPAVDMPAAVAAAVDATAKAYQSGGKIRGLSFGLRDLDSRTLGAMPGQLIVIGGRSSMGKSAFALSLARNFGRAGNRSIFFSLEMGADDLTTRMIADEAFQRQSRLSYWQISSGKYHESKFELIAEAGKRISEYPIRIEQQPGLTVAQIASRARQYKRRHGLKAIFVDHLGLIRSSGRYAGNRVYEIGETTGALKELAKELAVPVILLAQLNRGLEARDDKRPTMADLRSSGDIEQDADTIMLLYRPAYYLSKKEPLAGSAEYLIWTAEMEKVCDLLEVGLEKQRSGPTGRIRLFCDIGANAVRDEVSDMDDSLTQTEEFV